MKNATQSRKNENFNQKTDEKGMTCVAKLKSESDQSRKVKIKRGYTLSLSLPYFVYK